MKQVRVGEDFIVYKSPLWTRWLACMAFYGDCVHDTFFYGAMCMRRVCGCGGMSQRRLWVCIKVLWQYRWSLDDYKAGL